MSCIYIRHPLADKADHFPSTQCFDWCRPAQSTNGLQVCRLALWHVDAPRRSLGHLLHSQVACKVHGPRPQPHHLFGSRLHLLWAQRSYCDQYSVYAGVARSLCRAHCPLCGFHGLVVSRRVICESVEDSFLHHFDTPKFPAVALSEFYKHYWHHLLHYQYVSSLNRPNCAV